MENEPTFSLEAAWDGLRRWALFMLSAFGAPATIAARLMLGRDLREEMVVLLAPLETGVRSLLLLEALALPKPDAPAPRKPDGASCATAIKAPPRARATRGATFRLWPRRPRKIQRSRRYRFVPATTVYNALPIARRVEAVLRALNDRAGHAIRLARHIHAEPAQTHFRLAPYRAPRRTVPAWLQAIERQAERAVMQLNLACEDTS